MLNLPEPLYLVLLISLPLLARLSGRGFFWRVPSILLTLPFGLESHIVGWLWSYVLFETGHGTAFHMGRSPSTAQSQRKQFLSPLVDTICCTLGHPLGGSLYCWLFMGLKGWLIALPLGSWYPLYFALVWPLSYEIGFHLRENWGFGKPTETGEYLTGFFTAVFFLGLLHFHPVLRGT